MISTISVRGTRPFRPVWAVLGLAAACVAWPAAAQDQSQVQLEQAGGGRAEGWSVMLGGGGVLRPKYDGADSYGLRAFPAISVSYDKGLFFAGPAGIGMTALNWHGFRAGPVLGFQYGRKEDDDIHLKGLGDIQPSLTAGMFASYSMGAFSLRGTVRQALTHQANGLYGDVSLNWAHPLIQGRLFFGASVQTSFASGSYARTYFGVSPEQSLQSGLAAYTPGGGIKDVGFNASLDYRLSRHWGLRGFAGVRQLLGDDGNSPVVLNKTQGLVGLGVGYRF